mmetsp:Transcript_84562/g.224506  ORF Transcript_84562/g.224506 Transcript_84562/m.224506 type:complete len:204 (+) Transcript_84562:453-1064(+)
MWSGHLLALCLQPLFHSGLACTTPRTPSSRRPTERARCPWRPSPRASASWSPRWTLRACASKFAARTCPSSTCAGGGSPSGGASRRRRSTGRISRSSTERFSPWVITRRAFYGTGTARRWTLRSVPSSSARMSRLLGSCSAMQTGSCPCSHGTVSCGSRAGRHPQGGRLGGPRGRGVATARQPCQRGALLQTVCRLPPCRATS